MERERSATGLPHWIFVDEAHRLVSSDLTATRMFEQFQRGVCLVSYRPEHITGVAPADVDVVILTPGLEPQQVARMAEATARTPQHIEALLAGASLGEAIIIEPTTAPEQDRRFNVGTRRTSHVRHWHKYARLPFDPSLHFQFRSRGGHPTGRAATSLYEFHHILRQSPDDVIEHHLERKDFSRWIHAATRDDELCDSFSESEGTLDQTDIGAIRVALVQAIEHRYLE